MGAVHHTAGEAVAAAPDAGAPWDEYTEDYLWEMGRFVHDETVSVPLRVGYQRHCSWSDAGRTARPDRCQLVRLLGRAWVSLMMRSWMAALCTCVVGVAARGCW
jgi:hypothetical protein